MPFKVLSSNQNPSLEEMRKKMKQAGKTTHVSPIMAEPPAEKDASPERKKRGRKSVKIYTRHFSTYLSAEQENALYNWCEENGVTPSVAIRMAIAKMVAPDYS